MVTAEFAVALPALALVVAASIAGIAARLAARGEPLAVVRQAALRAAPHGAQLRLVTSGGTVIATVTSRLAAPSFLHRLPALVTSEQVVAARESVVLDGP